MYDLVISGGKVYDGSGSGPISANVYVKDGKIAEITSQKREAKREINAHGLCVAPGFIDIHSHSDKVPFVTPNAEGQIRQGVTTEVVGNCGEALIPCLHEHKEDIDSYCNTQFGFEGFDSVSDYAAAINESKYVNNIASLVGHSNLRIAVMGFVNREPDEREMRALCDLLDREMQRGAFGMSIGLIYPPSAFSAKEELIELSKVVAKHNGIFSVHMRSEGPRIFEAVDEVLEIAEKSGVHLEISHLKLMGKAQWGKAPELVKKIEDARKKGVKVTCDQYPFTATCTALSVLVPHWAHEGGAEMLCRRVAAREGDIEKGIADEMENRGGPDSVMALICEGYPEYEGKFISEIAKELGLSPVDTVCKLLIDTKGEACCNYFSINEQDVKYIMQKDFVSVGSDGVARDYTCRETPHPRNFAAFSQYFQTVRENKIMPLEKMIRKATSLTAQTLGIKDRGLLKEGYCADIVVFDGENFGSQSTFLEPKKAPKGMKYVLVNGIPAVENEKLTGARNGIAILKNK